MINKKRNYRLVKNKTRVGRITLVRNLQHLIVVLHRVFFFVAPAIFFLFIACEEKIKPSIISQVEANPPSQESWNSQITVSDSGINRAIIHAGYIAVFDEKHLTLLDSGMMVDFFDSKGNHTTKLTAKSGNVNDQTNDLEAVGHVVVVSDSGTILKTEKLFWTNSSQKVHSPEYVEITSPSENLNGYGFESDQDLKNYKVFRVTGKAKVKGE